MKLSELKLTAHKQVAAVNKEQQRRNKLIAHLTEQRAVAVALASNTQHAVTRTRTHTDAQTGLRVTETVNKRVKYWFFKTSDNRLALTVRYGTQVLELARGKFSIDVADMTQMAATIDVVIDAVG
jgi:hypothetical protein